MVLLGDKTPSDHCQTKGQLICACPNLLRDLRNIVLKSKPCAPNMDLES